MRETVMLMGHAGQFSNALAHTWHKSSHPTRNGRRKAYPGWSTLLPATLVPFLPLSQIHVVPAGPSRCQAPAAIRARERPMYLRGQGVAIQTRPCAEIASVFDFLPVTLAVCTASCHEKSGLPFLCSKSSAKGKRRTHNKKNKASPKPRPDAFDFEEFNSADWSGLREATAAFPHGRRCHRLAPSS